MGQSHGSGNHPSRRGFVCRHRVVRTGSFPRLSFVGRDRFSITVQDTDRDGLLDVWEGQRTVVRRTQLTRRACGACPILKAMGAKPAVPDVFVEIDYLASTHTLASSAVST